MPTLLTDRSHWPWTIRLRLRDRIDWSGKRRGSVLGWSWILFCSDPLRYLWEWLLIVPHTRLVQTLVNSKMSAPRTNSDHLPLGTTASLTMSDDEDNLGNAISGTFFGALAGGGIGLGACMLLFDDPPFFIGDTILIGAIACGLLGFFLGAGFIEWLKENWWGFWW